MDKEQEVTIEESLERKNKREEIFALKEEHKFKKPKKRRGAPVPFKKGNKIGVRFGEGQSRAGNGRPRKPETILDSMKEAAERYGFSALEIAEEILKIAMDETIDPKVRFPFIKEANLRIFGAPKGSIEESMQVINNRVDKIFELTVPVLEATVQNDVIKIVSELVKQGKLDEVLEKVKEDGEHPEDRS